MKKFLTKQGNYDCQKGQKQGLNRQSNALTSLIHFVQLHSQSELGM